MEILSKVSDAVLEKPVKIEIEILNPSKVDKLLKRKSKVFFIKPLSLGTLVKISKELLSININIDPKNLMQGNYQLIQDHSEKMAGIIAMAIVNNKHDPPESLIDFFINNLTASELYKVLIIVVNQMRIEDFFRSIISVKGMTVMNPQDQMS